MAIIKTVSLSEDHALMVKREGVSLSAVLRTALEQLLQVKNGEILESNAHLQAKIQRLLDNQQKLLDFLNAKGLFNEYYGILEQKQ